MSNINKLASQHPGLLQPTTVDLTIFLLKNHQSSTTGTILLLFFYKVGDIVIESYVGRFEGLGDGARLLEVMEDCELLSFIEFVEGFFGWYGRLRWCWLYLFLIISSFILHRLRTIIYANIFNFWCQISDVDRRIRLCVSWSFFILTVPKERRKNLSQILQGGKR